MGIELMYRNVATQRIVFTPLVTNHDPCRDARGTHHEHKTTRKMLTKTTFGTQEKIIYGVQAQRGWFDRAGKILLKLSVQQCRCIVFV